MVTKEWESLKPGLMFSEFTFFTSLGGITRVDEKADFVNIFIYLNLMDISELLYSSLPGPEQPLLLFTRVYSL